MQKKKPRAAKLSRGTPTEYLATLGDDPGPFAGITVSQKSERQTSQFAKQAALACLRAHWIDENVVLSFHVRRRTMCEDFRWRTTKRLLVQFSSRDGLEAVVRPELTNQR